VSTEGHSPEKHIGRGFRLLLLTFLLELGYFALPGASTDSLNVLS